MTTRLQMTTLAIALALAPALTLTGCNKAEAPLKTDKPAPDGMAYAREGDKELMKARITALEHFEEFAKAFKERQPEEKFAVKAAFQDGEQKVHKWLIVDKMENLDIVGHFAQNDSAGNLQAGQPATARTTDIDDWSYVDKNGGEHGGYTIAILKKRQAQ